jgi:hypothetical protein
MKIDKQQVAGYGLHYHANNQLITKTSDRVLFQCLIDLVRGQLRKSLDSQTIFISASKLAQFTGLTRDRTIPASIHNLELMGLVKQSSNAITVCCDEYVAAVQYYESVGAAKKIEFAKDFAKNGVHSFPKYGVEVQEQSREELLGMTGSSISVPNDLRSSTHISQAETCVKVRTPEEDLRKSTHPNDETDDDTCVKVRTQADDLRSSTHLDGGDLRTFTHPNDDDLRKTTQFLESESETCVELRTLRKSTHPSESEPAYFYAPQLRTFTQVSASESKNCVLLRTPNPGEELEIDDATCVLLRTLLETAAQIMHFCSEIMDFDEFCTQFDTSDVTPDELELLEYSFSTGKVPNMLKNQTNRLRIFTHPTCVVLRTLTPKTCVVLRTSNNSIIKKENNLDVQKKQAKNQEKSQEKKGKGLKGFEGYKGEEGYKGFDDFEDDEGKEYCSFGKLELPELIDPSDNFETVETDEEGNNGKSGKGGNGNNGLIEDFSQQVLKRAERSLRVRNPYRNKPFLKVDKVKDIVECLDEVVKSPVDFFLYQFWWGIFDLYCEHYHPSQKIDEEGELIDEPQAYDWKEMISAPLPQDEIYQLAKNVYEDLLGAVEQGRYVYGDHNEWEVKFAFSSFEDFIPYEIFQWKPYTMQDDSIPALIVAIDKFYDIEAKDVYVPSKADKRVKTGYNKKFINLLLAPDMDASQLTPMEAAVKRFYDDFVLLADDNTVNEYTDGRGTPLESGGGLPDHLLKPWCYDLPSITYDEFTGVFSTKYKPISGMHKNAYLFSAEAIVEWNERNGYHDTLAHEALKTD